MSFKTVLIIIVFTISIIGCTDFINPLSSEGSSETTENEFLGDPDLSGGSENGSVVIDDEFKSSKDGPVGGPNMSGGSENG